MDITLASSKKDREPPPVILEARNLSVSRGNGLVLDGVSLQVRRGEILLISGRSGSGKSTLLWTLARLATAEEGDLLLESNPSHSVPPHKWRQRAVLLQQKPALEPGTVLDNVLLPWRLRATRRGGLVEPDMGSLRGEMDRLGLADVELGRPVSELSGGEAARVAFLRAVMLKPLCLLLDEPYASLDEASAQLMVQRLQQFASEGGSAVVVRHGGMGIAGAREMEIRDFALRDVS